MTQKIHLRPTPDDHVNFLRSDLKVLIADKDRMFGDLISQFLVSNGEFSVNLAETLDQTLHCVKVAGGHDLVLLNPIIEGIEGAVDIGNVISANFAGSVVLLVSHIDLIVLRRSLKLGLKGVIPKATPLKSLIGILKLVHSGEVHLPPEVFFLEKTCDRLIGSLTETEIFVLRLVAMGLTNKRIARELDENEVYIKMCVRSICRKLNARNRTHASMLAQDLGVLFP
jgi:two-component system nitrate/nitrite response regulator NarP